MKDSGQASAHANYFKDLQNETDDDGSFCTCYSMISKCVQFIWKSYMKLSIFAKLQTTPTVCSSPWHPRSPYFAFVLPITSLSKCILVLCSFNPLFRSESDSVTRSDPPSLKYLRKKATLKRPYLIGWFYILLAFLST